MNQGADAADQMVSYGFRGMEVILRLTGAGAKNLALFLAALLKDNKKMKGKTTLQRMIKDGRELKVFQIDRSALRTFAAEAKRYGVLFTALHDRKNPNGPCDILVRAEDASKINRIIERLKLATVEVAGIKAEVKREKENPTMRRSGKSSGRETPLPSANSLSSRETQGGMSERFSVKRELSLLKQERTAVPVRLPTKGRPGKGR